MSRAKLRALFDAAIKAVAGRQSVARECQALSRFEPEQIVAVGKAAEAMLQGAHDVYGCKPSLLITKHGHSSEWSHQQKAIKVIESGHPIPDQHSLDAGKVLLETVKHCKQPLLLLVSGGASALAECLKPEMTLDRWQNQNQQLIGCGKTISEINDWRKQQSLIKSGQLLSHYNGPEVVVMAVSDVQGDDLSVIASGLSQTHLCKAKSSVHLVATNAIARNAAARAADELDLPVMANTEVLYGDIFELSHSLAAKIKAAEPGLSIFGGEPTVVLPPEPGNGGRNQSLALALAEQIQNMENVEILVAGTDGTDGPTDAAGGIVDGYTFNKTEGAGLALIQADAGRYLRCAGDIFITGPTGTNVMDLMLVLKG